MPRPTEESLSGTHNTQGFTPGGPSTFKTGVYAPLDVAAAPSQAQLLARALGKANDSAQDTMGEMARQQGSANEASGEADEANGTVDPAKMKTVIGYADGVQRTQAERYTTTARMNAIQYLAQNQGKPMEDTTNADGTVTKGFKSGLDDVLRASYPPGYEKVPEQAKIMGPAITHTFGEILGQKTQMDIKRNQQSAVDSATSLLMLDAQTGSKEFNADVQYKKLLDVNGQDPAKARADYVHAIGEAGASTGRPDLIKQYLPQGVDFGGGATLTPENRAYVDSAIQRATEQQQHMLKTGAETAINNATQDVLGGKDSLPLAKDILNKYAAVPGMGEQVRALIDWQYRRGKQGEADTVESNKVGWKMSEGISDGTYSTGGQLMSYLRDNDLAGTKIGNQLLKQGMQELSTATRIDRTDMNYQAYRENVSGVYAPVQGPLGKIMNPAAKAQQMGALVDYNVEYDGLIKQGKGTAEAARKAWDTTRERWGDPLENPVNGQITHSHTMPKTFSEQASIVQGLGTNVSRPQFLASGVRPKDVDSMLESGLLSREQAKRAYDMYDPHTN